MNIPIVDLRGRTAMVVGAGGFLGPHFATALARAGADLVLVDLGDVSGLATDLAREYKIRAVARQFDLAKPEPFVDLLDEVETSFGPIDILHGNAASKGGSIDAFCAEDEDYDLATWREIVGVNLDALFFVTARTGKRMADRGKGSIILTSSIYGVTAPDQRIYEGSHYLGRQIRSPAVYSASKAGVVGLTRHFASLWGSRNVRVNCIAPGGVFSGQNDVFVQNYSRRIPMGRMAEPSEMTGALLFFASDMSTYVTGQVITIDGGLTAW